MLAGLLLAGACAKPVFVETDVAPREFAPRRLVLVPFRAVEGAVELVGRRANDADRAAPRTDGAAAIDGDDGLVSGEAAALVTAGVLSALTRVGAFEVIPPGEVILALRGIDEADHLARLVEVFAPDAIVSGRVLRFDGRIGQAGSAIGPSHVIFTLDVTSPQGQRQWRAVYEEAQSSLFEDLSSFARARERGFRWVGPESLARYGSREVVRAFAHRAGVDAAGLDRSGAPAEENR